MGGRKPKSPPEIKEPMMRSRSSEVFCWEPWEDLGPGTRQLERGRGSRGREVCRHLGWKPNWQVHARALGAVAVGAPIGGLPAALARDPAPHLHRNASLRAPADVAAQLLSGPFWGPQPKKREGTRSKQGVGFSESATKVLLWTEKQAGICRGWDTTELSPRPRAG